jgi:hypothetical protein
MNLQLASDRRAPLRPLSGGGFNRSTQHLLILLGWEVIDGRACADVVYAASAT